jgi:hypothetical protein
VVLVTAVSGKAESHESATTIPIGKRTNAMDFDNFWTEELETNAITEVTGLELQTSYEDEEHPCYVLTDSEGSCVHVFDHDASIEDVYELLCQHEGVREAFEEYYADFYREMQRLNPNGVQRSSFEKHFTTYQDDIDVI